MNTLDKLIHAIRTRNAHSIVPLIQQLAQEDVDLAKLRIGENHDTLLHFAVQCSCEDGDGTVIAQLLRLHLAQNWLLVANRRGQRPTDLLDRLSHSVPAQGPMDPKQMAQKKILETLLAAPAIKWLQEPIQRMPWLYHSTNGGQRLLAFPALPPLSAACAMGDHELIQQLIDKGAQPAMPTQGYDALSLARIAAATDLDIAAPTPELTAALLADKETDPTAMVATAFLIAVQKGDAIAISLLLRISPERCIDPHVLSEAFRCWQVASNDKKDNAAAILTMVLLRLEKPQSYLHETTAMMACALGDQKFVKKLIRTYPEFSSALFASTAVTGENLFHTLCREGHVDILREILFMQGDSEFEAARAAAIAQPNHLGQTPLFLACASPIADKVKRNDMVGLLVSLPNCADFINTLTRDQQSVLSLPHLYDDEKSNGALLNVLLRSGADANLGSGEHLPLNVLFKQDHPKAGMAQVLLKKGASLRTAQERVAVTSSFVGTDEERYQVDFYMRACELQDRELLMALLIYDHGESIAPLNISDPTRRNFITNGYLEHAPNAHRKAFYYAPLMPYQVSLSEDLARTSTLQIAATVQAAVINTAISLVKTTTFAINPLHYLAKKGNHDLLSLFCNSLPMRVLIDLLKPQPVSAELNYDALAERNYKLAPNGQGAVAEFNEIVSAQLCIHNIHRYFIGKSQEKDAGNKANYRERLAHFAKIINHLTALEADQKYAKQAYALLDITPQLKTGGFSLGGWAITKSQDRYRGLIEVLPKIPANVIHHRLNEYCQFINQDSLPELDAEEAAFIADLKAEMQNQRAERLPTKTDTRSVHDYVQKVIHAIRTHNQQQLSYWLNDFGINAGLWSFRTSARRENILQLATTTAIANNDLTLLNSMLTALMNADKERCALLLTEGFGEQRSMFKIIKESTFPKRLELLELFFEAAVAIGHVDATMLVEAVETNSMEVVDFAIANKGKYTQRLWETVFAQAVAQGNSAVIQRLLDNGFTIPVTAFSKIDYRSGKLSDDQRRAIFLLLSKLTGDSINFGFGEAGDTPLMIASYLNLPHLTARLLEQGAKAEALNQQGSSALSIAISSGADIGLCISLARQVPATEQSAVIKSVCEKSKNTLLHLACLSPEKQGNERAQFVKYLLQTLNCAEIINSVNAQGFSPLHLACKLNDVRLMAELIAKGADLNLPTTAGTTPLGLACLQAVTDPAAIPVIELLLKNKKIAGWVRDNEPALNWACQLGHWDLAAYELRDPRLLDKMSAANKWEIVNNGNVPAQIKAFILERALTITTDNLKVLTPEGASFVLAHLHEHRKTDELEVVHTFYASTLDQERAQELVAYACHNSDLTLLRNFTKLFEDAKESLPAGVTLLPAAQFGSLGQLHLLCKLLPAEMIIASRQGSGEVPPLDKLIKQNPKYSIDDLNMELDFALCFHNIHAYLVNKSQKSDDGEVRRYEQRLNDFVGLLFDIQAKLTLDKKEFRAFLERRLADMPELETNQTVFMGLRESQDRYRRLRQNLMDADPEVVRKRCAEYWNYVGVLAQKGVKVNMPALGMGNPECVFAKVLQQRLLESQSTRASSSTTIEFPDNDASGKKTI